MLISNSPLYAFHMSLISRISHLYPNNANPTQTQTSTSILSHTRLSLNTHCEPYLQSHPIDIQYIPHDIPMITKERSVCIGGTKALGFDGRHWTKFDEFLNIQSELKFMFIDETST